MEKILLLAHVETGGTLSKASLEAVSAALSLSSQLPEGSLSIGLIGSSVAGAATELGSCGAGRVLAVEGEEFAQPRYVTDAAAAEAICRQVEPSLILAAGTSRWSRALPGVACRMGGRVDSHVSAVEVEEGQVQVTRWYYRQRMKAVLTRTSRPWFILGDPGTFEKWSGAPQEVEVERVEVELPESIQSEVTGVQEPGSGEKTIRPDADLLFVAGAGWTKKQADGQVKVGEAEKLIRGFLDLSQASLGGSKSMVDLSSEGLETLSFMSHLNQIGQTGATPRHPRGLSTCCHGEEPHVVGWRFVNERRAVNLDPNCGWAQGKADVLYVADAFEVVKRVNELLAE